MLGLTQLQHALNPATTVDKFIFLMEYAWTHSHALTATISFAALFLLLIARSAKQSLRKHVPAIFYVPEVFLVVVLATGGISMLHINIYILILMLFS